MTNQIRRHSLLLVLVGLAAFPAPGFSQNAAPDLTQLSIEDLMQIEVTSASRKEQHTEDVAAAVFVITHDDIRRSGMTTIPDLLRMVPGVEVAQINSNKWAVTVRGFNGLYANKLLVLIDGRSVYNRIFAGVLWNSEDLPLDDVDRVEVIRGPGAALWGANAVNGVINIITKTAADTQGGLVRVDAGGFGKQGAARYGGALGAARYRVYAQWTGLDQSLIAEGTGANDASHSVTTGFRMERATRPGAISFEGAFTTGQERALWPNLDPKTAALEPIANDPTDENGAYVLGRLTHTRAGGASLQFQSSVDIASRQEPLGDYKRRAVDADAQYHATRRAHQDLVAGAGFRFIDESFHGGTGISLTPDKSDSTLLTAFLQDEIALFGNRMAVTLGTQVQHDSDFGAGVQPTARVMWKGLPRQRLWAATSRALRTPSLYERGIRLERPPVPTDSGLPLFVIAMGNPAAVTENLVEAEAGYRLEVGTTASIDVTGFVGRYDHLSTTEPGAPVVLFVPSPHVAVTTLFGNQLEATTRGLEVAGQWIPVPAWRFDGGYTAFRVKPELAAASHDPLAGDTDGNAPQAQWQARSAYSPATRATFNVALFHAGPLARLGVDAYTRTDLSAEWRFNNRVSVMAIGQNIFDAAHAEFGGPGSLLLATQVARSAGVRLRWTFQ